jgi:hypothetical protein
METNTDFHEIQTQTHIEKEDRHNNLNQQQIQEEIARLKCEDVNEDEEWRYMPQRSESEIQRDLEEEERYRNYDPEDDGDEHDDDWY